MTRRLGVLRPDSIRVKILVLAVLATLLPSVATAWISYLQNQSSLTAKATEELLSVSAQTVRELDLWAKERRYDLRVFASSYEITENVGAITRAGATGSGVAYRRVTDYLKSVSERFQDYDELSILGPSGQVVASNGSRTDVVALPEDWQARLRTDDFAAGTPYWDADSARPKMVIAVPIIVAGGDRVPGAMAAEVDLATLRATLARFAPGESGHVSLLTADGSLIVSSQGASADAMRQRYASDTLQAQLANDGQPVELTDVTGERALGSMRRVSGLDWAVVAAIPSAEVYGELARIRNASLLIVVVMLILAGGLGYTLGLVIVRPLDRLTRAAAKVAGGDLDVDLTVTKGGEVGYLTEVFTDMVSRLRTSRIELERLSVTDPLTGLDNRRRMTETLQNEVLRSRRLKHSFAVLMADVDRFKAYNDAHGHPAGDEALRRVAAVLRETTRDVDSVSRYGGEEFFVLMPETSAAGAVDMAERIKKRLVAEAVPGVVVTLSFGVAEFPIHGHLGEALIDAADAALYEAKRSGRNCVVVAAAAAPAKAARG